MHRVLIESTSDDAALMASVASGSREALRELYERHARMAYRTAYRVTGSRADAEDVVHDVFVALPRAARRYREVGSLGGWLRTVVVRAALKRVRRSPGGARSLEAVRSERAPEPSASPGDPVDLLELRAAIRSLPATLRVVFMLKEIEGYTHAEIAAMEGITRVASRVRLHRAWAHLRERMGVK